MPFSFRKRTVLIISATLGASLVLLFGGLFILKSTPVKHGLTKEKVASFISGSASFYQFPTEIQIPSPIAESAQITQREAVVQYSFDQHLQTEMQNLIKSYGPDFGAFVAIEPETGRVLSMISFTRDHKQSHESENLVLQSTFPSASVFKVVTAAAAIENKKYNGDTVINFQGANHTLYKSNILKTKFNRWTRHMTLKEAFAKSVNTVFGRIGAYAVGSEILRMYAGRFGFNRTIASDVSVQEGHAPIPSGDDAWGLAETASGYTRDNTMSPLQGALIAAAIANDGPMMEPYIVDSVYSRDGLPLYTAVPKLSSLTVDATTAAEIRTLMRQTVKSGTSSHVFRRFFRHEYSDLDVGGKTGSLTGLNPPGKYDWFVGYGSLGKKKIAIAALTIHEKLWRVKSSYLARRALELYFGSKEKMAFNDSKRP